MGGDIARTNEEWREYAAVDPLFAIASWGGRDNHRWTEAEFYALGQSDWRDFSAKWSDYGDLNGVCLELGCGAGRITAPMSDTFDRIIACDVSEEMLRLTEGACRGKDVVTHRVDGTRLPAEDGSIDAVFSCHVLQHLEMFELVENYFREMHRVLRGGGTAMVHLLVGAERHPMIRSVADFRRRAVRVLRGSRFYSPCVRYYLPSRIRVSLESVGYSRVELREFCVVSNDVPHAFWFATKG